MQSYKVVIIAPTPFYYQVPLFKVLANHPRIELVVFYCSKEALEGRDIVKQFNTRALWGVGEDLLQGYNYKFPRNYSPFPSYLRALVGLMNFGIWFGIWKSKPDAVILMSWMNPTWWLAVLACVSLRVPFYYLTDQNVDRELIGPVWKRWIKSLVLGKLLFPLASGFLCAGTANMQLYSYYGVPDGKLLRFAFSWGYEAMLQVADELEFQRTELRSELGIPENSYVFLFCGRLSKEKSPLHLLEAYHRVALPHKALVFVGDGGLRKTLQDYVIQHNLDSVYFFGFQNRKEVPKFYAISDVLVIPSREETWGMVVNEALCFGLPVIISDQVGAGADLVRHGYNGFGFAQGNVEELAGSIERCMQLSEDERSAMGRRSLKLIQEWVQRDLAGTLVQYLDVVNSRRAGRRGHGPA